MLLKYFHCFFLLGAATTFVLGARSASLTLLSQELSEQVSEHPNDTGDVFFHYKPLDLAKAEPLLQLLRDNHARVILATANADAKLAAQHDFRRARRALVAELLREHATKSQRDSLALLAELGYVSGNGRRTVKSFWINNSLFVRDMKLSHTALLTQTLTSSTEHPAAAAAATYGLVQVVRNKNIAHIIPAQFVERVALGKNASPRAAPTIPWPLQSINIEAAWQRTRGSKVTVANIDTGVRHIHEALQKKYRGYFQQAQEDEEKKAAGLGLEKFSFLHRIFESFDDTPSKVKHEFNWFDPQKSSSSPDDWNGHGTHTMGSIVGSSQDRYFGVAPDAMWIAARGCSNEGCSQFDLTASAQWVMCPTDESGSVERCDLGADIVSNSWGGDEGGEDWFYPMTSAWVAAGMIPIFAAGNAGPECSTIGSPGDLINVISVGASSVKNVLAPFSSRGPGVATKYTVRQKPDVCAPGVDILSTYNDGSYARLSGTSMATPHVSGVAALMLAVNPTLDFAAIQEIMNQTANSLQMSEPDMGTLSCSARSWDMFPNFHYGFGQIDAGAAVAKAAQYKSNKHL